MTWMLRTDLDLEAVNVHLPALRRAGLLGISEQDGRATVYLPRRVEVPGVTGSWERVLDHDWDAIWRRGLDAVTVGAVTVAPPWVEHDDRAVVIEPGQAFGTGHHETTTACLGALQGAAVAGRTVLDVGTGSGVLAICADRLGAARVVAIDIDPVAVEVARANVVANGAAVDVRSGSAADVDGEFDVVVANLDTATLVLVAGDLRTRLAPAGTLIASGVSRGRLPEAVTALEEAGLLVDARPGDEWVLLHARRQQ